MISLEWEKIAEEIWSAKLSTYQYAILKNSSDKYQLLGSNGDINMFTFVFGELEMAQAEAIPLTIQWLELCLDELVSASGTEVKDATKDTPSIGGIWDGLKVQ